MENGIYNNNSSKKKINEHEVNTCFAPEFTNADSVMYSAPDNLSSAGSTFSMKDNSSISGDTTLDDSSQFFEVTNSSYVNKNISGVDELIRACVDIQIDAASEETESLSTELSNSTQDHTFVSATDEIALNVTDVILETSPTKHNLHEIRSIDNVSPALDVTVSLPNCCLQTAQEDTREHLTVTNLSPKLRHLEMHLLPVEECVTIDRHSPKKSDQDSKESVVECIKLASEISPAKSTSSIDLNGTEAVRIEEVSNDTNENKTAIDNINREKIDLSNIDERNINEDTNKNEPVTKVLNDNKDISNIDEEKRDTNNTGKNETSTNSIIKEESDISNMYKKEMSVECINIHKNNLPEPLFIENEKLQKETVIVNGTKNVSSEELDDTITISSDICTTLNSSNEAEPYEKFKPQRQSTSLFNVDTICTLKDLELAAEESANDIFKSCLESEVDVFTTPVLEIFEDPMTFDFLSARGSTQSMSHLRKESLYIKFDPLLANVSMSPQENSKFCSTPPSSTINKLDSVEEKNDEPTHASISDTKEIKDPNATNLESVRATILELQKALDKQEKENNAILEQQKTDFEKKIMELQLGLTHVIQEKNHLTVVIGEYEKSISRLLAEKERDLANLKQEKAKLQEELQDAKNHLNNTEAAFNDVHLKYEKLKGVLPAYKNNEEILKESIRENSETIKSLENRYEQLKSHATLQLKQANFELANIRKQQEAEKAKLNALVRKAELKSNSLAETIEQKTKENEELQQIIDELTGRLGHQNTE